MHIPNSPLRPHVRARDLVLYGAARSTRPHEVILGCRKPLVMAEAKPVIETDLTFLSSAPDYVPIRWATPEGLLDSLPLEETDASPAEPVPLVREEDLPADPVEDDPPGYHGPPEQKQMAFS